MKLFKLLGVALVLAMFSAPAANATTFTYEGFTDFTQPGGQGGTFVNGDFDNLAAVLAQNESDLGLPAGSIQEIGKFNVGGSWDNGVFGANALTSFTCSGGNDPCHSFSFQFDPTAESLVGEIPLSDWTLVKIAMKIGNTGGEDSDLSGHGFWVVGDGEIDGDLISFSDFDAFGDDIDKSNGNSHIHFFGVQTTRDVSEPGVIALFGIGLIGLGFTRRRRKAA